MNDFYIVVLNPNGNTLAIFETFREAANYCNAQGGLHVSSYRLQIIPKEGI